MSAIILNPDHKTVLLDWEPFELGSERLVRGLYKLCDDLPLRPIPVCGMPYLERYALAIRDGADGTGERYIYLHRFLSGDGDRHLHSHPWALASGVILTGGYTEDRFNRETREVVQTTYRPGDRNHLRADDLHQIRHIEPGTWTLFEHGPWLADWGFVERFENGQPVIRRETGDSVNRGWWNRNPKGRHHPERQPLLQMAGATP